MYSSLQSSRKLIIPLSDNLKVVLKTSSEGGGGRTIFYKRNVTSKLFVWKISARDCGTIFPVVQFESSQYSSVFTCKLCLHECLLFTF